MLDGLDRSERCSLSGHGGTLQAWPLCSRISLADGRPRTGPAPDGRAADASCDGSARRDGSAGCCEARGAATLAFAADWFAGFWRETAVVAFAVYVVLAVAEMLQQVLSILKAARTKAVGPRSERRFLPGVAAIAAAQFIVLAWIGQVLYERIL